jgi:hypothetical protein
LIWFILQFVLSYGAAVLVVSLAGSKSLSEVGIVAVTFGIVALPFGLIAGGLSRLFERVIGWPGAIPAVIVMLLVMYLIARNKVNYTGALGTNLLPAVVFAGRGAYSAGGTRSPPRERSAPRPGQFSPV